MKFFSFQALIKLRYLKTKHLDNVKKKEYIVKNLTKHSEPKIALNMTLKICSTNFFCPNITNNQGKIKMQKRIETKLLKVLTIRRGNGFNYFHKIKDFKFFKKERLLNSSLFFNKFFNPNFIFGFFLNQSLIRQRKSA